MTGLGTALASVAQKDGVLKLVYKDLAQPGVQQVGRALSTVLGLGNSLLLPLRLLNETARKFEERKFEDIASRFSVISEDEIVDVRPEIGVEILDKLSIVEDNSIREMFVELLAKAATSTQAHLAHPSFVSVISSLTPDEAILIRSLMSSRHHPIISIVFKEKTGSGRTTGPDLIVKPPDGLLIPDNIPLYVSNLIGLGLIEVQRETYLTAPDAYDATIDYAKMRFKFADEVMIGNEVRRVEYNKDLLCVLPYGQAFINACIS